MSVSVSHKLYLLFSWLKDDIHGKALLERLDDRIDREICAQWMLKFGFIRPKRKCLNCKCKCSPSKLVMDRFLGRTCHCTRNMIII